MTRLVTALILPALAIGCGTREEYKPSGSPAIKLEIRAASNKAVDGWQATDDPNYREPPKDVVWAASKVVFVSPETVISNADVASTGVKPERERWFVAVRLTDAGRAKLAKLSRDLVPPNRDEATPRGLLAILLDGKLASAPVVNAQLTDGTLVFGTYNYTEAEARRIAKGMVGP